MKLGVLIPSNVFRYVDFSGKYYNDILVLNGIRIRNEWVSAWYFKDSYRFLIKDLLYSSFGVVIL